MKLSEAKVFRQKNTRRKVEGNNSSFFVFLFYLGDKKESPQIFFILNLSLSLSLFYVNSSPGESSTKSSFISYGTWYGTEKIHAVEPLKYFGCRWHQIFLYLGQDIVKHN